MTNTLKKQFGMAILLLTVTLLVISTLLIFFTARYSGLQQKISTNYYKNQQALQAAQAGIEIAIPYFQTNYNTIIAAGSGGFLQPYRNSNTQNVALSNGSQYSFVFSNSTANNYQLITITSTGVSADASATRTITQQIMAYTTGPTPPPQSFVSQANITLRDSSVISNTTNNSNVISGGNITIRDSAQTITSSGVGSSASHLGSDIQQNNSSIANMSTDQFLTSVIGVNQSTLQSMANLTFTNSNATNYSSALNGKKGAIIWINQGSSTATINGTTTIGSPTSPVILVFNGGQLKLDNNTTIYGLLIIINSTGDIEKIEDNTIINGAVITNSDIRLRDNATINYNPSVLNALPTTGGSPSYSKLPGSWRDF